MILDYNYLREINTHYYDKKEVTKLLIKAKKSKNKRKSDEAKKILFLSLSRIVVKNIENFFKISIKYSDLIHDRNDLVSECYLTLDKCVEKYDLNIGSVFYWYYNKSLTFRMQRIIEKNYYKHRNNFRVEREHESFIFSSKLSTISTDFTDFYLDIFQVTDEERKIIEAKMTGKKIKEFVEDEMQITWNEYYKRVGSIKNKLKTIRDEFKHS